METLVFGRYRLEAPAGMGGSAQVWRACDERTGDVVAVKRLHPIVLADASSRLRLVHEFRALHALDHPRIVRVRDLEIASDDAALILDFIPGQSLADRLIDGPLTLDEVVSIVRDIGSALDAAHAAGILHRDVKPGNILLRDDGSALLTDFGIAGDGDGVSDATVAGTVVGTLRYMSPDRLAGRPARPSDDVYSLGVVAWQALAGRPPYDASTPVALITALEDPRPRLEGVPTEVESVIARAMAPAAGTRFADAGSFARALEAATAEVEPATEPATAIGGAAAGPSVAPGSGRPVSARRTWAAPLAGLAGVALAIAFLAGSAGWTLSPGAQPTPAARATGAPAAQIADPTPNPTRATPTPALVAAPAAGGGGKANGHQKDHGGNGKGRH